MNKYDIGDKVRLTLDVQEIGAYVDPSTVVLKVKKPDTTVTTYTYGVGADVVKSATGRYFVLVSITAAGAWYYRWETTGPGQGAEEGAFTALKSKVL
jgi:hypothetical protein